MKSHLPIRLGLAVALSLTTRHRNRREDELADDEVSCVPRRRRDPC